MLEHRLLVSSTPPPPPPRRVSDSAGLRWTLRTGTSKEFSGINDAANPETTVDKALIWDKSLYFLSPGPWIPPEPSANHHNPVIVIPSMLNQ